MFKKSPIVRSADIGYGHVKWTEGRDSDGNIIADSFASLAPLAVVDEFHSEALLQRDTHIVPINGKFYEVGRNVHKAIGKNQELEQLNEHFALSDGYAARLFGAFNYMLPNLPSKTIDYLMLGLPLTTLNKHQDSLSAKFVGEHVINKKGDRILVRNCAVYPQPLGGYAAYYVICQNEDEHPPLALLIDVGYNTVDWITCEGLMPNANQSGAVERGMSGFLREVAKSVMKAHAIPNSTESLVVRLIDQVLMSNRQTVKFSSETIDLTPHLEAGDFVLEQAARAVQNNIGHGVDIEVIIMSGGGAARYAPWIKEMFPKHEVRVLDEPELANVRGFHQFGDWIAESAARAAPHEVLREVSNG